MATTPKSANDAPLDLNSPESELEMRGLALSAQANEHLHDLRHLTSQETNLIAGISMGLSKLAAAKRAGMGVQKATTILADPSVQHHLDMLHRDRMDSASTLVKYDLVDAHMDIEMGKKMSGNAMEWFRGVEMHMKLHGIAQEKTVIDLNIKNIQKVDQLAELDDAALLELMGKGIQSLVAQTHDIIDGELSDEWLPIRKVSSALNVIRLKRCLLRKTYAFAVTIPMP